MKMIISIQLVYLCLCVWVRVCLCVLMDARDQKAEEG